MSENDIDRLKKEAGERAAEMVEDGMLVGLGSGSTAREFVRALGTRVASGLQIRAVASSTATAELARSLGIDVIEHEQLLDLAVDGADAVEEGTLAALKGLGGALVREKLVAQATDQFVLVVDQSKIYSQLSDSQPAIPVPVEVVPFGWKLTRGHLYKLGHPERRMVDGEPFISDNGNFIIDLYGCEYRDLADLAERTKAISGVVDHGLFFNLATQVIVASEDGVEVLSPTVG